MGQLRSAQGRLARRVRPLFCTAFFALIMVVTGVGVLRSVRAHEGAHADLVRLDERLVRVPESVPLRVARVDLLLREGRVAEAVTEVELLEWLASSDPRVPFVRAQVLFAAREFTAAEADLLVLEARSGLGFQGYWLLARTRDALERPMDAVWALDAALAEAPHIDAALMRARLQTQLGHPRMAREGLMEVLLQIDDSAVIRREVMRLSVALGDMRGALAQVDALAAHARNQGALLLERGRILRAAGDEPGALEAFARAVQALSAQLHQRPAAAAFISRALAHEAIGDRTAAMNDARTAIQMSPDFGRLPPAFTGLARRLGLRLRQPAKGGR